MFWLGKKNESVEEIENEKCKSSPPLARIRLAQAHTSAWQRSVHCLQFLALSATPGTTALAPDCRRRTMSPRRFSTRWCRKSILQQCGIIVCGIWDVSTTTASNSASFVDACCRFRECPKSSRSTFAGKKYNGRACRCTQRLCTIVLTPAVEGNCHNPIIILFPAVMLLQDVKTHWSGHLCLASGTSDLSPCRDGSPAEERLPCAWPSVHAWQKRRSPAECPFSFLAYRLIHTKEAGIFQGSQWFLMVHHPTHPNTPSAAWRYSETLDTLLRTRAYSAQRAEAERLEGGGWRRRGR